jgi:cobalamin biosynthesis Mg chelatase CobN
MIADDPFGAYGGSAVPIERSAKVKRLSLSIAEGLSAEAAPEKPKRRGSEQRKPAGLSQEELQRRIEVIMNNPKHWQEFKQYLAESNIKGSAGTQKALREFIEQNKEIAAEGAAIEQEEQQRKRSSALGRSLLGAVNSLTSELSAEEASAEPQQQQPNAQPASSSSSAGTSRVTRAARSSFSSASNMGMNFLRKAGEVATSSISGLDKEAEETVESNASFNASSINMSSLEVNSSSADLVRVLSEWFGDETVGDIPAKNEESGEEIEAEEGKPTSKEKK